MKKFQFTHVSKRLTAATFLLVLFCAVLCGCCPKENPYAQQDYWAYYESAKPNTMADVFFVCPTVYGGDDEHFNMSLTDEQAKAAFLGATNMEKGIYDANARFFAPYYRQVGLNAYLLAPEQQEPYLNLAYEDVKHAFEYYLEHENGGRPIILAGFSQGADMCLRLLKEHFKDSHTNSLLVACYAIGWRITEQEMQDHPHIRFANTADDVGVVVSFNSEAPAVSHSLMIPNGIKTLAINPLNWKTDGTVADRSLNLGACFTDYDGHIVQEIPHLCGGYIDSTRGALKVTDITPEDYPAALDIFDEGCYHLYDYQFFYRNLHENVATRIAAYLQK